MYSIFGGKVDLHFPTQELYDAYNKEQEDLYLKFYGKVREIYGVWASNQDKFVPSVDDLNSYDQTQTERMYQAYLRRIK